MTLGVAARTAATPDNLSAVSNSGLRRAQASLGYSGSWQT